MHLLIDMNLSPRWVSFLLISGFEAVHWSDVGPPNAPDTALMDHARRHGMVILTHDLDFGAILAAGGANGPSVVQIRSDNLAVGAIGALVVAALRQMEEALILGALVTIDTVRTRMTVLPIEGGMGRL